MADIINIPTFEQIETVLSRLATNYSELAIVFYDVFYNPEPKDVMLQMFDEAGVLQTYVIPNRAKDMRNILSGEGTPQDNVEASKGVIYQDLENGDVYIKLTATGNTGWSRVITGAELDNLIIEGIGSPEGVVIANKGTLYLDRKDAGLYMKTQADNNIGWALISANTENLADKSLSNLTSSGEAHFAKPNFSNITSEAQAMFNAKQNINDRANSISGDGSTSKYPSTKAVVDYVAENISDLADVDFSNISAVAENRFIGIPKLNSGILESPAIMYRGIGNSFTLPAGTKLSCCNGLTDTYTLNNEIVVIQQDLAGAIPNIISQTGLSGYIFYEYTLDDTGIIRSPQQSSMFYGESEPTEFPEGGVWFKPSEYMYYVVTTIDETSVWVPTIMVEIGTWETHPNGSISKFNPYYPIRVATSSEIEHVVIEAGGSENNWYRLYKDGWIEAGGYLTGGGTVNFHKEFKSNHYTLVPSSNATSFTKATDSFTITAADANVETDWVAHGWGA